MADADRVGGPRITISHMMNSGGTCHSVEVPQFGLGVFLMSEAGECESAVRFALQNGYRHIDTAMAYGNEAEVGAAIRNCGIPRDEIFVTTKLRQPHAVGEQEAMLRCRQSLENLGLDQIDLYLVHAPATDLAHRAPTWRGMENCLDEGLVRAIGVSNHGAHHLDQMRADARYLPSVNQIEVNPWLQRPALLAATRAIGATPMAYSPLARGHKVNEKNAVAIAERIGGTAAQVAIKWCIDEGCITIPKSSNEARMMENLASLEVDISSEKSAITELEENYISGWDPTAEP